jgi:hypothetical protein
MSDLSYRLALVRPALRPSAESIALSATFVIANMISQEPVYLLILLLLLAVDVLDLDHKRKSLVRDFVAGAMITLLALSFNDQIGLYAGSTVAIAAFVRIVQKSG